MRFFSMDASKFTERLPGTPDQARRARLVIGTVLGDAHPCADDALLLASELTTNAIRHSDSSRPGGSFALVIEHTNAWVRVSVGDDGSGRVPCLCPVAPAAAHGRGMKLVDGLAVRWGLSRQKRRNEVWFEVGR
jgi:anti-sigma regulatory factor (Ser/Thr protein kinase)